MQAFDVLDDDIGGTVFRDVIMLALAGFVTVVLLLLPHLNPKATAEETIRSPGNVIVELRWPDELDADVDLWVQAPGDVPVGYSNKGGAVFNLLRDDLGHSSDLTGLNYEFSFSRGVPSGDYTVNVHLFRNQSGAQSIPVTVAVSIKSATGDSAKQILATQLPIMAEGQELTALRFSLDDAGHLVDGSVHDIPRSLRSQHKS